MTGKLTAKLRLEKRASGKSVTVVDGLPDNAELVARAREGVEEGLRHRADQRAWASIELQGDQRERLRELLATQGFRVKG